MDELKKFDPMLDYALKKELNKQKNTLNLIPSENIASKKILNVLGSVLTNKYSEGYPKKRYYGGNKFIDEIEELAIERAKKLFGAEHANVQPHSGTQANMAALFALLNPKDKILSMDLFHGGHLTHGSSVNFSGKSYEIIHYGVNKKTELIDMDEVKKIAIEHKPRLIIAGATAYPRKINFKEFKEISNEVGSFLLADISHIAGLISSGLHESSIPYADITTSTTHKTLRGPRGGLILCNNQYSKKIDKAVFPGIQGGPLENTIAAKAVAFKEALQPEFKNYSEQIIKNAKTLAESLIKNNIKLVSNGTDNHLILIDLSNEKIKGKESQEILEQVNIIVNKNTIPFDTQTPENPSGIRIGTPALTTRGFKKNEMEIIGEMIAKVIQNHENKELLEKIKNQILILCKQFPIYNELEY